MFHSTRGEKLVSSPMAILNGLADDGADKTADRGYYGYRKCHYAGSLELYGNCK